MEGYDTRACPFTGSEGRLRAPGQNKTIRARATGGFEVCGSYWLGQPRNAEGPHVIGRERDQLIFDWLDFLARFAPIQNVTGYGP